VNRCLKSSLKCGCVTATVSNTTPTRGFFLYLATISCSGNWKATYVVSAYRPSDCCANPPERDPALAGVPDSRKIHCRPKTAIREGLLCGCLAMKPASGSHGNWPQVVAPR
jgi:hypothetical protein